MHGFIPPDELTSWQEKAADEAECFLISLIHTSSNAAWSFAPGGRDSKGLFSSLSSFSYLLSHFLKACEGCSQVTSEI